MVRGSDDNRMSHNFMVVDGATVFVASNGPVVAGGVRAQLYNVMTSEDLAKDFTGAFQQMFGGVFATTVTSYGEPMPSNTNNRTRMPMQDGSVLSTWFGRRSPSSRRQSTASTRLAPPSIWRRAASTTKSS